MKINLEISLTHVLMVVVALAICFSTVSHAAPNNHALVIGVPYKGSLNLEYTDDDATQFGNILSENFNFTVKYLVTSAQTTRGHLYSEFEKLQKESKARPYDKLIIFYSGHGQKDTGSSEVGYLLPSDVNSNSLFSTAIDMSIFRTLSKTVKAKQLLFIIDACYSGIIGAYNTMDVSRGGNTQLRARQILTAGKSDQSARVYPTKELSIYTHFLLNALSYEQGFLRSDANNDGEIDLWELQTYLDSKVSTFTGKKQTPKLYNYTEDDGLFAFPGLKPKQASPIVPLGKTKDLNSISESRPMFREVETPSISKKVTPDTPINKDIESTNHDSNTKNDQSSKPDKPYFFDFAP